MSHFKNWIALLTAFAIPLSAVAADFDRTLQSGTIKVRGKAAPKTPDKSDTASLGLLRVDTKKVVFCADAIPGAIVSGVTSAIANDAAEVFLELHSFSKPSCAGLKSGPSSDRYRVVFGAPGVPTLLKVVTAP